MDDLQYEEVAAELRRNAAPAIQVLQDFGIMKLDEILHAMATALDTSVVKLKGREISPDVLKRIPAKVAQMYQCLPVALENGVLQVALAEPLDPAKACRAIADSPQSAAVRQLLRGTSAGAEQLQY